MRVLAMGVVLALGAGASGCVSFEAVKGTAAIGQRFSGYEHQFDAVPVYCEAVKIEDPKIPCTGLAYPVWVYDHAALVIAKYSNALVALAGEDKVGAKEQIDAAFSLVKNLKVTLPSSVPNDLISAAVGAIVDISLNVFKGKELKTVITELDPHVATLAKALHDAAKVQRDQLESLSNDVRICEAISSPPPTMRIMCRLGKEFVKQEKERALLYDATITSFQDAHHLLATEHFDSPKEDLAIFAQILGVVGKATNAVNTALTPPTSKDSSTPSGSTKSGHSGSPAPASTGSPAPPGTAPAPVVPGKPAPTGPATPITPAPSGGQ